MRCSFSNGNENREQTFSQHQQVTTNDKEKKRSEWRDQLNFNEKYDDYQQQFEEMVLKSATMLNERLNQLSVTKHFIHLSKEAASTHPHLYRAGPSQRRFAQNKVDKMLKNNFFRAR